MARVSKRSRPEDGSEGHKIWNTAIYARLSSLNMRQEDDSTLETQIEYVKEALLKYPDLRLITIYKDNGYTGTNFERPGFTALMDAVRSRKIDCVMVKDLSRFGRNLAETGEYLEVVFPFLGVRFLSVNDAYDSLYQKETIMLPVKSLLNEYYAKDISNKVKHAFRGMEQNGEIYTLPPYGYQKDPARTRHILPDPETCSAVKEIFLKYLEGIPVRKIAADLNRRRTTPPGRRKIELGYVNERRNGRMEKQKENWSSQDVRAILDNPLYTGSMVYNRFRYENKRRVGMNPKSEWRVCEHTHEALISEEMFEQAWSRMRQEEKDRKNNSQRKIRRTAKKRSTPISAGTKTQLKTVQSGEAVRRRQEYSFRQQILREVYREILGLKEVRQSLEAENRKREQRLAVLAEELQGLEDRKKEFYEEMAAGAISRKMYLQLKESLAEKETLNVEQKRRLEKLHFPEEPDTEDAMEAIRDVIRAVVSER